MFQFGGKKLKVYNDNNNKPIFSIVWDTVARCKVKKTVLDFFFSYPTFAMRGSPTYIINVLIVTLLPGSDGLGLYALVTSSR